jgi:hypothetical protein
MLNFEITFQWDEVKKPKGISLRCLWNMFDLLVHYILKIFSIVIECNKWIIQYIIY